MHCVGSRGTLLRRRPCGRRAAARPVGAPVRVRLRCAETRRADGLWPDAGAGRFDGFCRRLLPRRAPEGHAVVGRGNHPGRSDQARGHGSRGRQRHQHRESDTPQPARDPWLLLARHHVSRHLAWTRRSHRERQRVCRRHAADAEGRVELDVQRGSAEASAVLRVRRARKQQDHPARRRPRRLRRRHRCHQIDAWAHTRSPVVVRQAGHGQGPCC